MSGEILKAAIYARYSSENQRETSLEDQIRLCRQEADRLSYAVTKVYTDRAMSGQLSEDQRPGFAAVIESAKHREFDVLIVDDASRLSRNAGDALKFQERMRYLGIGLVSRADGINTVQNPRNSDLVFGIKSVINREFVRDLGEKVWRGLEGRARKGFNPGGLPYGYRSEPVHEGGRIIGYRRVVYQSEADVVRRIFRLYVGDEDGQRRSSRQIAKLLNAEGISPPGARWQNRTTRQAKSWSYTAIIGHRRLGTGILNNRLYIGKATWNRSQWMRDPDTRAYRSRIRPANEWVEVDVPELQIVSDELWEKAQARAVTAFVTAGAESRGNVGKYLLSGFVKCAVCGGNYTKANRSYRCGTRRNRGEMACSNARGISVAKLDRAVIAAIREHLYTPENVGAIIRYVRDELAALARQKAKPTDQMKALREVEREIQHIKRAVKLGKATESLLEMLEDAERRRKALIAGQDAPRRENVQVRLERVLADLPARVQACLQDLETLLRVQQVERGRAILGSFVTEIRIHPDGTAEICGDLHRVLSLVSREKFTLVAGAEGFEPPTSGFGDRRSAS